MSDANFWDAPSVNVPVVNADGNIFEETQVAAAAQTVFNIASFTYTPNTKSIFVWKNGNMLRRGVDFTETSGSVITLAVGAALNDKVTFIAFAIQQIIPPIVFNGMPAGGTANQVLTKSSGSDYEAMWSTPAVQTSLLDAARVNIASASTVNLAAIAATTRNIQITGSINLDGFQVTNGQVWVVKFAASLVLKNNANIVTQAGQDIKVSPNDSCLLRATADNVVEVIGYSRGTQSLVQNYNDFRLTLTTGVPVTTADVIAAATLYCTPYKGNKISLFNGTSWVVRESAEFNIALAGLTVGRPYDVFCYDNAGVPTLELLSWASTTARATALAKQDGVYVKGGDATRKYLGSFHALSATTTTDSERQRLLWNYYNRVIRKLRRTDATGNWVYNSNVIRQARADVLNQLEVMCGVVEDGIDILIEQTGTHSILTNFITNYIGIDSTTVQGANTSSIRGTTPVAGAEVRASARLADYSLLGFHYYAWLENNSSGAGVATFNGSVNANFVGTVTA